MSQSPSGTSADAAAVQVSEDALFSIVPVFPKERIWGTLDYTLVNAALAIATWCFLTGGYLASVVPFKVGIAALIFGLFAGYGLTLLGGSLGSCKYGIDLYQQVRSSFGCHAAGAAGLFVCLLMVYLNNAIIFPMLGKAMTNVIGTSITLSESQAYWLSATIGIIGLLLTWLLVYKGPVYLKILSRFVTPALLIVMGILLFYIFRDYGWSTLVAASPTDPTEDTAWNYAIAVEWSVGFAFSWWWIMGAMARITRTQRAASVGFVVGTGVPAAIAILVGMMSALVVGSFDPTEWLIPIAGVGLGVVALVFVAFANISSGALMAYSGGIASKNYSIARKMSWKVLTLLVLMPAIVTMLFQDFVYDRLGTVLAIWAVLLAPLSAVVFTDYHILRRQHLNLKSIYDTTSKSEYYFWYGVNPAFIVTMAVSFIFYYMVLDPLSLESAGFFKYTTAALPTFAVACIVYYAVTRLVVIPLGRGGYPKLPENAEERRSEIRRLAETI